MTTLPPCPSRLRKALGLEYPILGLWYEDSVPDGAVTAIEGASRTAIGGCVLFLVSLAFRGDTAAFTPETSRCLGSSVGLGLPPNPEEHFPGGREALLRFLANGNGCSPAGLAEAGRMRSEGMRGWAVREYLEGEGLKKSPELAAEILEASLATEPEGSVAILRPLSPGDGGRPPRLAVMLADSLQLSALVVLANFARPGLDSVRIPMAAGCATIAAIPLREARQETPRAVVGLTDVSSRRAMRGLLRRDLLAMTIPWPLYCEMEGNAEASFLSRPYWKTMMGERPRAAPAPGRHPALQ
ncbi:MAG: DUF169 domain-containing protein [Deltaproteobacteria bacterium]|jgi:hypothetical protein|nr:DUF169 domain-containing protein [Deltaproteobacteria bacterium]